MNKLDSEIITILELTPPNHMVSDLNNLVILPHNLEVDLALVVHLIKSLTIQKQDLKIESINLKVIIDTKVKANLMGIINLIKKIKLMDIHPKIRALENNTELID